MLLSNYYYYKKPMIFAILHSFVNIFADGRSDIKTILFFVYLLFLGLLYLVLRKKPIKKINWLYFAITISAMYLYGLILEVLYTFINNASFAHSFITGNNNEISYSNIWHIHLAKASIGVLLPHFTKIDSGGAYLGVFPDWVFLIGSFLLVTLLFQALLYFISSFRNILKDKKPRQIVFLITGYAFLSFSIIKTSIDGGIFYPAFVIGGIFIILFILKNKNKLPNYSYYLLVLASLILMMINIYQNNLVYGSGWVVIESATLIALYTIIFYCSVEKKINLKILIPLIILFLINWNLYAYHDIGVYKYSQITPPAGTKVYFYSKENKDVETLIVKPGQNVSQLAKQLDRNLNYLPIAIPNLTCKEGPPNQKVLYTVTSNQAIAKNSFEKNDYMIILNGDSVKFGNKWQTMLVVYKKSCLPEQISVINGELIKNNIISYVYYGN